MKEMELVLRHSLVFEQETCPLSQSATLRLRENERGISYRSQIHRHNKSKSFSCLSNNRLSLYSGGACVTRRLTD